MDINKKIDIANNMCLDGKYKRVRFTSIYPFTTEDISAYIDMFNLKDKSLLTVGSSADQALNAILQGCDDITIFDICPFTEEYFFLKYAAVKLMNREEFLDFFCYKKFSKLFINNKKAFLESSFYYLLDYLDNEYPEVSYFWSELLKKYNGRHIRKYLFSRDEYEVRILEKMNRYLENDESYNQLKKRLDDIKINFKYDNIFNIDDSVKYDNIFLSNIAAYHKLDDFVYLFNKVTDALNDNGKMLACYLYDTDYYSEYVPGEDEIYNLPLVFKNLPKDIKFTSFVGNSGLRFRDKRMKDSIITYKKVKKI